ncbi:hypothetical protein ACOSQ2_021203 [Xanthoceras sorbifolium]
MQDPKILPSEEISIPKIGKKKTVAQKRSNSDSLKDSSASGNDYRALRRKYLLLEEESFVLGKELREAEDEKVALLDQLVVLGGLIDPSDVQPKGSQFS